MGHIKNRTDIQNFRHAARIAGEVCDELMEAAQPGVSSVELEMLANRLLQVRRSSAPFKTFEGFNHAICLSLNEEIVNGPPSRERVLAEGDLVKIAVGSCFKSMHGKAARTVYLGDEPPEDIARLMMGTAEVLERAIEIALESVTISAILEEIPNIAVAYHLANIKDGGGCGIGKFLHEAPWIPNAPERLEEDIPLMPGLAFTLMPMMALGGDGSIQLHEDGWTHMTSDGSLAAHFADTFFVGDSGLENLSKVD